MEQDKRMYYAYLDELRESGLIDMFGAAKYLEREFPELTQTDAASVLRSWMNRFAQRSVC